MVGINRRIGLLVIFPDDNHEDDERRKVAQAFKTGFLTGWTGIIARYVFSHADRRGLFIASAIAFGWRFRK